MNGVPLLLSVVVRRHRLLPAMLLLIGCWSAATAAPPHLNSVEDHPFDPDWIEVYSIVQRKCLGCHIPGTKRADLSSYEAILNAEADGMRILEPGDPDMSMLFDYVSWNASARRDSPYADQPMMPPDRHEWLTARQLEVMRRWIANGALQYQLPSTCNTRPLMEMDFPSARQCASCHPRQYEQWARSMHAYAQHSPVFEAFNLTLVERTSGTIGTFCTRCHTPIGTALGENESRRNANRSRLSMEGITCVVCHRQARPQHRNSGRIEVQPGGMLQTCVHGPFEDAVSAEIGAHPSQGSSYLRTSQFCGNCHDVTNPAGVRLEEAFSEWLNSPAASEGIRCHDCHMGPVPGVPVPEHERPLGRAAVVPGVDPQRLPLRRLSDHTFPGPDYSLLPDTEFPYKLDWMYEVDYRQMHLLTPHQQRTLTELRRKNRKALRIADQYRYTLLRNGARLEVQHPTVAACGDRLPVDVRIQSTLAGHSYPTGFSAERQLWVSIEVRDPLGRLVFVSGDLDQNGDLRDDHSHEVLAGKIPYDRYLLNFQNKFTLLANRGTERTVILSVNRHQQPINVLRPATGIAQSFGRAPGFRVAKGSLPPLKSAGRTYPVTLPDCPGYYSVQVRLNFRHLPPNLLDEIGIAHLKHLLEVVTIDEYQGHVQVFGG